MTLLPQFPAASDDRRSVPALLHMLWIVILVGAATLATGVYACAAPFQAVAAMAALTLSRRTAVLAVVTMWLGNQVIGFGIADYPWTANAFAWGVALCIAIVAATLAAAPVRDALAQRPAVVRFVAAFAVSFVTFQLICTLTAILFGEGALGPATIAGIAEINAVWAVALLAAHSVLGALAHRNAGIAVAAR